MGIIITILCLLPERVSYGKQKLRLSLVFLVAEKGLYSSCCATQSIANFTISSES
jgi:hypothetical protein